MAWLVDHQNTDPTTYGKMYTCLIISVPDRNFDLHSS